MRPTRIRDKKMEQNKKEIILKWMPIIFTIIAGAFTLLNYLLYDRTNHKLVNAKLEIDNTLRQLEFENNLKLTLYREVKDVIGQKDTALQNATLLVVNEILRNDTIFKENLVSILLQFTNSNTLLETQQKIDAFEKEERIKEERIKEREVKKNEKNRIRIGRNRSAKIDITYSIDIYYLEDSTEELQAFTDSIAEKLRSKNPNDSIRPRLLPKNINVRKEYRVTSNQIRYNISDTAKVNKIIKDLNLEQFKHVPTNQPTNICIFIRNK